METWKLIRCRELRREAEIAEERLIEIQPTVSASLDPTPRGTKTSMPTENVAINRISVEELMAEIVAEYQDLKAEIATACRQLSPTLREVVIQRYIDGDSWEEIADKLNYSKSYIYDQHRQALEQLAKI